MSATAFEDRAAGALMGALIGDALGVGPHWYYNLHELRAAYGPWISDYTTPKPGRYHAGLKAGQSSQAGWLLELTMTCHNNKRIATLLNIDHKTVHSHRIHIMQKLGMHNSRAMHNKIVDMYQC